MARKGTGNSGQPAGDGTSDVSSRSAPLEGRYMGVGCGCLPFTVVAIVGATTSGRRPEETLWQNLLGAGVFLAMGVAVFFLFGRLYRYPRVLATPTHLVGPFGKRGERGEARIPWSDISAVALVQAVATEGDTSHCHLDNDSGTLLVEERLVDRELLRKAVEAHLPETRDPGPQVPPGLGADGPVPDGPIEGHSAFADEGRALGCGVTAALALAAAIAAAFAIPLPSTEAVHIAQCAPMTVAIAAFLFFVILRLGAREVVWMATRNGLWAIGSEGPFGWWHFKRVCLLPLVGSDVRVPLLCFPWSRSTLLLNSREFPGREGLLRLFATSSADEEAMDAFLRDPPKPQRQAEFERGMLLRVFGAMIAMGVLSCLLLPDTAGERAPAPVVGAVGLSLLVYGTLIVDALRRRRKGD